MDIDIDWNTIRYLAVYPALVVGGIAWAIMFFIKCYRYGRYESVWAMIIGVALAIAGVIGEALILLDPSKDVLRMVGPPIMLIPAVVLIAGAAHLFVHEYVGGRNDGNDGP